MASTTLQLRVKTRDGQFTVDSLTPEDTIGDLKAVVWTLTKLNPDECRILIGFPPEELFLVDNEQLIGEIIKSSRETLTMESLSINANNQSRPSFVSKSTVANAPPKRSMRRVEVPANNSCLFVSVNFCMTGKMKHKCPELRELIAETVKNDPISYNEGFLEKPNSEYCTWIRNEDHWGGGIELSILSKYYQVEIVAVDTQNIRLNRFGEDLTYPYRIFLIFDGIHYDPLVVESSDVNNPVQTKFSSSDSSVIDMALEFARVAKEKHQYTDLKRMVLHCNKCNKNFANSADARAHAAESGHIDFSEIASH